MCEYNTTMIFCPITAVDRVQATQKFRQSDSQPFNSLVAERLDNYLTYNLVIEREKKGNILPIRRLKKQNTQIFLQPDS
jgi:hypothetical protein